MNKANIGLIGLAVMGENLARNMERNGFTVAVYNRHSDRTKAFAEKYGSTGSFVPVYSLEDFVTSLASPRIIIMMVKAGSPVDSLIENLLPLLSPGDILIDGGNSLYTDTQRRIDLVAKSNILFVGCGISGGEEGALNGPSIMPGGAPAAWKTIAPILTAIAARAPDGTPCCTWIGSGGAGHFVKMVHNGIEYGDMQLIAEAYHVLRIAAHQSAPESSAIFSNWNKGDLNSYLIEITADILSYKDTDGAPLIDRILDTAQQKGTGRWTVEAALLLSVPLTLITEAVSARQLSSRKKLRTELSDTFSIRTNIAKQEPADQIITDLGESLFCAKIISYAQGFDLLLAASKQNNWNIDPKSIAMVWRGGCIIRSGFLTNITEAFAADPALPSLLSAPFFAQKLIKSQDAFRRTIARAVTLGIPVPAMSAALAYFDGLTSKKLPANLISAQRDYFGAHQYERTDAARETFFHTDWTGKGGATASSMYSV